MIEKADFIKRLVDLRVAKGASAQDMSLSIGQSPGYINNIENGVNYPSMTAFSIFAIVLALARKNFLIWIQPIQRRPMLCWPQPKD